MLEGVPKEMPALARADRLTEKASRIGFDWPDAAGAREKVAEELGELDEAMTQGDGDAIEHELGDLLFAVANLSRKLGVAPEEALRGTLSRVRRTLHPRRAGARAARRRPRRGDPRRDGRDLERGKSSGASSENRPVPRPTDPPHGLGKDRG